MLVGVFFLCLNGINGQSFLSKKIDFEVQNIAVSDALLELSEQAELSIIFNSQFFSKEQKVTLSFQQQSLSFILDHCLAKTEINYKVSGKHIILFKKQAQSFTISGFIEDRNSGEKLISAAVWDAYSGKGTTTNEYGFFSLELPAGAVAIHFSYLGYEPEKKYFKLDDNHRLDIELTTSTTLTEVVVTAQNISSYGQIEQLGEGVNIQMDEALQHQALAGEQDLMRYIQTQAGVQSGTDGLGGMYVRGGSVDQNLVLLDDVPIFNPSHTLGLFSIFRTPLIRKANFIKENFSAKYGGRLSSVLSVRNKEGNTKKSVFEAETSLISTKATVEIPIVKNKSGLLVAGRRSHLDPLIRAVGRLSINDSLGSSHVNYFFYDFNLKFHSKVSKKDKLYISFYTGKDDYNNLFRTNDFYVDHSNAILRQQEQIKWGNTIAALRWNHLFSDKLFANTTMTYSKYEYLSQFKDYFVESVSEDSIFQDNYYTSFRSLIQDASIKTDVDYYPNNEHQLSFGAAVLFRDFKPGAITEDVFLDDIPPDFLQADSFSIPPLSFESFNDSLLFNATEINFYLEDQYQLSERISFSFGIRGALFTSDEKNYFSFQPRLAAEWELNKALSARFSVGKMTQFLHVLSSSSEGLPTDLWVPSTVNVQPEHAWQGAFSLQAQHNSTYLAKISTYYKTMNNLIRYKDALNLPGLSEKDPLFWEELIVLGEGYSYGLELELQKIKGRTKAGINYTFARSFRRFEEMNNNEEFPFAYDRPHSLKAHFLQKIGKKTTLTINWQYLSGRPITLISTTFPSLPLIDLSADDYQQLSTINGHRIPDYHRLDVGLQFNFIRPKTEHFLNIGVYNAYNQPNVFYEYWYNGEAVGEESYLVSQFGLTLLPVLSYRLIFSGKK